MPKRVTGKTHVGERRERRPNGDLYIYERITAYNEKTQKTYTVSQKLKGKIKSGTQEMTPTRPKKRKGEGGVISAVRRHTGLTDILEWIGKASGIDMMCCLRSARVMRLRFSPSRDTGSAPAVTRCHALRVGRLCILFRIVNLSPRTCMGICSRMLVVTKTVFRAISRPGRRAG